MTGKAVDNVIPLTGRLEEDIEAGVSGEANMLVPKSLCKKTIKYGLGGLACVRWKVRIQAPSVLLAQKVCGSGM